MTLKLFIHKPIIKPGVVRDKDILLKNGENIFFDIVERWSRNDVVVSDSCQRRDHRRDRDQRIDKTMKTLNDLHSLDMNNTDLNNPMAMRPAAGCLDVDNRRVKIIKKCEFLINWHEKYSRCDAHTVVVNHVASVKGRNSDENGRAKHYQKKDGTKHLGYFHFNNDG